MFRKRVYMFLSLIIVIWWCLGDTSRLIYLPGNAILLTGIIIGLLMYKGDYNKNRNHAVGALILGMNKDSEIFEKFCFVATQNTYFGHLKPKIQLLSLAGFGFYQPILTHILGYFQTYFVNLGESLPKGVSDDWRTLLMNKKSVNKLLEKTADFSKNLTQEVLYLHLEDDDWITEKGMKLLMDETFSNMKPIYRTVKVSESTGEEIGHINFFRAKHSKLWEIVLDWFS